MMKITTAEAYMQRLNTVFHAIVLVPLMVFILGFLSIKAAGGNNATWPVTWLVGAAALVVMASAVLVFISLRRYRRQTAQVQAQHDLAQRLTLYYSIAISAYVMQAAAATIPAVFLYVGQHMLFAALYVLPFLVLTTRRPVLTRLFKDLKLSKEERTLLKSGGQIKQ